MTAPITRTVDQHTGTIARGIWPALTEADERVAELKRLREVEAVFDEVVDNARRLARDNIMLKRQLDGLLSTDRAEMAVRNEELEDELRELRGIVDAQRDQLARAIAERDSARAERDTARGAVAYAGRRGW